MNKLVVDFKNISIYQKEKLIVSDISFTIQSGEFVYLIGRVGEGKSSLLKTLYGDLPVKTGSANVAGYDLMNMKNNDVPFLRRKIGIVFQDFQLLADKTVYENLNFVLEATGWKRKADINERIANVLQKVKLSDVENKLPHQLSGGEQQRVAIARALLNFPELIIADEPTGNLDVESAENVLELLKEICVNGTAVLMATHNLGLLKKFPARIMRIENTNLYDNVQLADNFS